MLNKKQTKLITGVHNYCDRWCERCPFTQRCAVGIQGLTNAQKDMDNEAFWRTLSQNFAKTFQLLKGEAKKNGFDLTSPTEAELLEFDRKDAETRAALAKPYMELGSSTSRGRTGTRRCARKPSSGSVSPRTPGRRSCCRR